MADIDDKFEPVTAADVADDNPSMIAKQLALLTAEVRAGFALIDKRFQIMFSRLQGEIIDAAHRVGVLERAHTVTEERLATHEERIAALERKSQP